MNETELDNLVARVQAGESNLFADVVFAIRKELRIFLSAHAASIDMVEEVLQSTLVTCYENIGKYELRGTFLSWTKGIARNLVLKELHARARYVNAENDVLERAVLDAALASEQSADREAEYAEKLRACIESLPDHSRDLIRKRYFDRLSVRDIARGMNRTETWAAVTLFRIRDVLRECMMKEALP